MHHIHFPEITSTHIYAKTHASEFAEHPITLITADYQTGGIGRKGDRWFAPKGTCLLATYVFTKTESEHLQNLAQVLAYSMMKVLERRQIYLLFKWPNDLEARNKKVGGVLADVSGQTSLLSIGLNVNIKEDMLKEHMPSATSLLAFTKEKHSIKDLVKELSKELVQNLEQMVLKGFSPFVRYLNTHLAYKEHAVEIEGIEGIAKYMVEDGRLVVETPDGLELFATGSLRLKV